jgi:hypothetical protein
MVREKHKHLIQAKVSITAVSSLTSEWTPGNPLSPTPFH